MDKPERTRKEDQLTLEQDEQVDKWCNLIRDEETLPSPKITWDEYRDQLNKTLKKGKIIVVGAKEVTRGDGYNRYKCWESRPSWGGFEIYKVNSIKRDRSAVEISFPEVYSYNSRGGDSYYSRYRGGELSGRSSHKWVPIEYILNITDYTLGDYEMFLCNRATKGEYQKWARYLLTAEEYARGDVKLSDKAP